MANARELLLEQVVGAFRETDVLGRLRGHPAWHDLSDEDREEAYRQTVLSRELEAAMDPAGLSSTAKAVLQRISAASE